MSDILNITTSILNFLQHICSYFIILTFIFVFAQQETFVLFSEVFQCYKIYERIDTSVDKMDQKGNIY